MSVLLVALNLSLFANGKNPVILIPGLAGSELLHEGTLARIWFKITKSKSEDLRLPVNADPTKMHDEAIPGDILRELKIGPFPITDVYGGFIKAMEERGGYHEENWDRPSENGFQDSLYVFPYDWRLDNVENARRLIKEVEGLKLKLNRPDLKFDIVAHSMGGIISRYAVMYGDADLPTQDRKPQPTWAGAKDFEKVILMGTPNEGSAMSLSTLLQGFTLGGIRIDLPFVQDTSKFTAFTIPSGYELLPAPGTLSAFDENLAPMAIDIYDPKVWSKYGWNAIDDKHFDSEFTAAERKAAPVYFAAMLSRAKRLHEALAARSRGTDGVSFFVVGADCKSALDSIVLYQDRVSKKWKTLLSAKGFTRSDGQKVTKGELKKIMYGPGDGIVTRRSLEGSTQAAKVGQPSVFDKSPDKFICEDHNKLAANVNIQDYIIGILNVKGNTSNDDANIGK